MDGAAASGAGAFIAPLARGLAVLSAFTPQDRWLGNRDIALRTRVPAPTVSRLLRSLVALGYLHYSEQRRQYRLRAGVLGLGYAAIAHSDVQRIAKPAMQALADSTGTYVTLGSRDGLDVIALETCRGNATPIELNFGLGARLSIASTPMGWALLAALPELERSYLLGNVERRFPHEWPRLRRRLTEAIFQVGQRGFCTALGEWDLDIGIVAAPLIMAGNTPMVLASIGSCANMTKARIERDLGPKLIAAIRHLQDEIPFSE